MNYKEVIERIASSIDMPATTVDKVYRYYWLFIRDKIESLDIKDLNIVPENTRTSFNIPSLGKLVIQENIERIKKHIKKHDKDKDD